VSRRLILFSLIAVAQLSTGCWGVRQRIAWRWHNHPAVGGPACAPCGPVCAPTPAFRIPSPVVGAPVYPGPVVSGPAPGCVGCSSGGDLGPVSFAVPIGGPGSVTAPPVIGPAMPLGNPRVEPPAAPGGAPKN
jgi:hypothetical protein